MGEKIRIPKQIRKPSRVARSAFQRSGAGEHSDKREGRGGSHNTFRDDMEAYEEDIEPNDVNNEIEDEDGSGET